MFLCPSNNTEIIENAHNSMPGQQVVMMCNSSVISNTTEEDYAHVYSDSAWANKSVNLQLFTTTTVKHEFFFPPIPRYNDLEQWGYFL